jgi:hypothetical protein
MLRLAFVLVCAVLVSLGARTTVASAATVNTRSDRVALQAYANYLGQIDSQLPTVRSRERQLGQQLPCHAVFTPGTSHGTTLNSSTETALEDEIGELVALRAVSLTSRPLATLRRRLQLSWSSQVYVVDSDQYLSAESRFIDLDKPNLCTDARVAAKAPSAPPTAAVLSYIRRYLTTYKAAKNSQKTFVNNVLVHNEAAGDLTLIKRINHLANVYQSRITSITEAETATITTKLGLS